MTAFEYDAAGRLVQQGALDLTYNGFDQLTSVTGLSGPGGATGSVSHAQEPIYERARRDHMDVVDAEVQGEMEIEPLKNAIRGGWTRSRTRCTSSKARTGTR